MDGQAQVVYRIRVAYPRESSRLTCFLIVALWQQLVLLAGKDHTTSLLPDVSTETAHRNCNGGFCGVPMQH